MTPSTGWPHNSKPQTFVHILSQCDEKVLKIGHYLVTIWTKVCGLLFGGPPCDYFRYKSYIIFELPATAVRIIRPTVQRNSLLKAFEYYADRKTKLASV